LGSNTFESRNPESWYNASIFRSSFSRTSFLKVPESVMKEKKPFSEVSITLRIAFSVM
jgi:hypothetical protein